MGVSPSIPRPGNESVGSGTLGAVSGWLSSLVRSTTTGGGGVVSTTFSLPSFKKFFHPSCVGQNQLPKECYESDDRDEFLRLDAQHWSEHEEDFFCLDCKGTAHAGWFWEAVAG